MMGGNTTAILQRAVWTTNAIGERTATWSDYMNLRGYLDMMAGGSNWTYQAKVEDASHIWIMDWRDIPETDPAMLRMVINGRVYEVRYVDDPMGMGRQIEIYLKQVGLDNA